MSDSRRRLVVALLVVGVWISAVRRPVAQPPDDQAVRSRIEGLIRSGGSELRIAAADERAELLRLYQPSGPLWVDAAGRPTANARDARAVLSHAADEGLDPADYLQDVLDTLTPRVDAATACADDVARFDVAISTAMLRYLHDVHMGRVDPRAIGFHLTAPRDHHDFAALLRSAIAARRVAAAAMELRPPISQYQQLRTMLARYRVLARDPTLVPPPPSTTIHPGEPYAGVAALQHLLVALGDLPDDAPIVSEARYEGALVDGVRRFQSRHGLTPDGVVGAGTFAALRVPLTARVRQIELALERLRWLPHFDDERVIALDIPMFRLWAWDVSPPTGVPALGMDVIVGRALNTQTPVFVDEMREVIFRPYWNVPPSILRHEILPKIARDPDYMRREALEIVRGGGDDAPRVAASADALAALRQGTLRVRQRPGPNNSLGLIKFVFPNEYDVYMHGTPAQALFSRNRRDFSHGCVRVRDPVALAEWVLRDLPEWTRERIVAATNGSDNVHVILPRPIRVILFYTTAVVMPETGMLHFADDIYRHDARLDRALASGPRDR